jgi:hypothetical protein
MEAHGRRLFERGCHLGDGTSRKPGPIRDPRRKHLSCGHATNHIAATSAPTAVLRPPKHCGCASCRLAGRSSSPRRQHRQCKRECHPRGQVATSRDPRRAPGLPLRRASHRRPHLAVLCRKPRIWRTIIQMETSAPDPRTCSLRTTSTCASDHHQRRKSTSHFGTLHQLRCLPASQACARARIWRTG